MKPSTLDFKRMAELYISYFNSDLGLSHDSKSADKELKADTAEKSKACVRIFAIKIGNSSPVTKNKKW